MPPGQICAWRQIELFILHTTFTFITVLWHSSQDPCAAPQSAEVHGKEARRAFLLLGLCVCPSTLVPSGVPTGRPGCAAGYHDLEPRGRSAVLRGSTTCVSVFLPVIALFLFRCLVLPRQDLPCFITATSPCFLWSSTTSWQIQSLVVLGDVFSVCGPIQVVNGFLMIPVEAGAVELGYFEGARRADLEVPCPIVDVSRKRRCGTSLVSCPHLQRLFPGVIGGDREDPGGLWPFLD